VEILSWRSGGDLVQTQTLRSHTRAVSDLNWHRFDPNLLASCSIDTFIHVWDIRDQRRPSLSLSAVGKGITITD
jgi:WD40 repeat protein